MSNAGQRPSSGRYTEPEHDSMQVFLFGLQPQDRGTAYYSAGGGEVVATGTLSGIFHDIFCFFRDEMQRPNNDYTLIRGPDAHTRPPHWMEHKNVSVSGAPILDEDIRSDPHHWKTKYRKELDIAEAIEEVRKQKRFEAQHDVLSSMGRLRRRLGYSAPLDESYAREHVEKRYRLQVPEQTETSLPCSGVLVDSQGEPRSAATLWKVLTQSVKTGKPLLKVAKEYRPRIDFYGLDPFLDSAPSLMWFSAKCGMLIGFAQGTFRAMQIINVDAQFLKASGVGVLSILNMSVFAGVVKWGGNTALLAGVFCLGDRLARSIKRRLLPVHDSEQRSTFNYVAGLSLAGSSVGVMPWWVLNDVSLAARMAMSGAIVGGLLGLGVGLALQRLVALSLSRLDATNRHLRRYEALMLREREWAQKEVEKYRSTNAVWW